MVDPNVLDACGIDSKVYSGYALGMGIERITNLKYKVKDLPCSRRTTYGSSKSSSRLTKHGLPVTP